MMRDDFVDLVYEELSDDSDNCRANRIIDSADEYAYPKDEDLEPCPFCGYRPRINITVSRFGKVGDCIAINLICDECNIRKTVHIRDGTELEDVQDAINKTIDDWNLQAKGAMRSFDNKWLECGKIMPPDGEYILIFDGRKVLQAIYYKSINGYWISGDLFIEGKDVNYWMPFPDPPNTVNK